METLMRHVPDVKWSTRNAAILCADVVGFMTHVRSEGAEHVVTLVGRLMAQEVAMVRSYGGEVQRIVDDGFIAVFGLGPQRGDEATRAVRAGAALVARAGDDGSGLSVHVGVEYGQVVISPSWEPSGFAAWGETVATAVRLCHAAGSGVVSVGPRAATLTDVALGPGSACTRSDAVDGEEIYQVGATRPAPRVVIVPPNSLPPSPNGHYAITTSRPALTRAEFDVARLVAQGMSNPQIAAALYISRHTVETHMKHIFAKLAVSSRAELSAIITRLLVASGS